MKNLYKGSGTSGRRVYKKIDLERITKITEADIAYILGFIAADGCLCKGNRSESLSIFLQKKDKPILVKIKKVLRINNPIFIRSIKKGGDQAQLTIQQKGLIKVFAKWCITPNKSLTIKFPHHLPREFIGDFIRGVFDGDGSVYSTAKRKTGSISFTSGSKNFINGISDQLTKANILNKVRVWNRSFGRYYGIYICAESFFTFYRFLYSSGGINLTRKRKKIEKLLKVREQRLTRLSKRPSLDYLYENYIVQNKTMKQISLETATPIWQIKDIIYRSNLRKRVDNKPLDREISLRTKVRKIKK